MLFFILKLYNERKYYISLTTHFYNEKKVLYKESGAIAIAQRKGESIIKKVALL